MVNHKKSIHVDIIMYICMYTSHDFNIYITKQFFIFCEREYNFYLHLK